MDTEEFDEFVKENEVGPAEVPTRYKKWWKLDYNASLKWREEAREDYDFVSGRQWSSQDESQLRDQMRPVITFNRTEVIIDAVSGNEIQNRNEVQYIPREMGDAIPNEVYSEAARWFDDESEAADEDSEAFRDSVICGVGCTETILNFDEDDEGAPNTNRIDPLEMCWDYASTKPNMIDARRIWRIKSMDLDEAQEMFPGVPHTDLDASSWVNSDEAPNDNKNDPEEYYENDEIDDTFRSKQIKVLHLQYWVWEDFYKVADPMTQSIVKMKVEDFEKLQKNLKPMGITLKAVKQRRKKYMQAFIGRRLLKEGPAPCEERFSWNFITAKRDRNTNSFYGLVRAMKDPQRWSNKWLAQLLHIMNSNSKGGLMIEKGAVEGGDIRALEDNWARPDAVIQLADGAIIGGKIKERPAPQFPTGYQILTEFAIKAIREVSGVSLEMLGLREMNQPNVLETSRKQAGMAVLAGIFNNLRRYRKRRGLLMLYYIQNYLSDGRLVRIVGQGKAQYVPLLKQTDAKFDVIVDESATSPNQKEKIWESLMQILPGIKDIVPPKVLLQLLEYSPIPATVVAKVKETVEARSPEEEEMAKMALRRQILELNELEANIGLDKVKAETDMKKTEVLQSRLILEAEKVKQARDKNQMDASLEVIKIQTDAAIQSEKLRTDRAIKIAETVSKEKANADKAKSEADIQKAKLSADSQHKSDQVLVKLVDTLNKVAEVQSRPREFTRGPDNRIKGFK